MSSNKYQKNELRNRLPEIDEIELPEDSKISLSVPKNTGKLMQIDVLVNGKIYGSASIQEGMTGEFDFGSIGRSKKTKKTVLRGKFPFKLTSFDVKTGVFNAHFERK